MLTQKLRDIRLLVCDVDGVLSDGKVFYSANGDEIKNFNIKDGLGIKLLQKLGIEVAIITGRDSPMVARRAQELGVSKLYQGKRNKIASFEELLSELALCDAQVAYAGDDLPDLPLLKRCGIAIAPADAAPQIRQIADIVTQQKGGEGCVREFVDLLIDSRDAWSTVLADFE